MQEVQHVKLGSLPGKLVQREGKRIQIHILFIQVSTEVFGIAEII